MAYCTISIWTATEWTDEMEDLARTKFVPLVMGCGASSVNMVRTGDLNFSVVTTYSDAAACAAAQAKVADIRAQAKAELPMTMQGVSEGEVFAHG